MSKHRKLFAFPHEVRRELLVLDVLTADIASIPGASKPRIREGVAKERRVSIEDADMRHGRKSETKRFNGYKRLVRPSRIRA